MDILKMIYEQEKKDKKTRDLRNKRISDNEKIKSQYKNITDRKGNTQIVSKNSNALDYEPVVTGKKLDNGNNEVVFQPKTDNNFKTWTNDYVKTAKQNAQQKTADGVDFVTRLNTYSSDTQNLFSAIDDYSNSGYTAGGVDFGNNLRRNISDVAQEGNELLRLLQSDKKQEAIEKLGKKQYDELVNTLKQRYKDLKKAGSYVLGRRDTLQSYKDDEDYKDDAARIEAYNNDVQEAEFSKKYKGYSQKEIKQALAEVKEKKKSVRGVNDVSLDKEEKFLQNYAQNYGYKDKDYYNAEIKDLEEKSKATKKENEKYYNRVDWNNKDFQEYLKDEYSGLDWSDKDSDFKRNVWNGYIDKKYNYKAIDEQKSELEHSLKVYTDYNKKLKGYADEQNSDEFVKATKGFNKDKKNGISKTASDKYEQINSVTTENPSTTADNMRADKRFRAWLKDKGENVDDYGVDGISSAWSKYLDETGLSAYNLKAPKYFNDTEEKTYYYYIDKALNAKDNKTEEKWLNKALDYYNDVNNTYSANERRLAQISKEYENAGTLKQIIGGVLSVGGKVIGGVTGAIDDVASVVTGNEIDPYSSGHELANLSNAVRQGISADIEKATGKAGSFLYNTGMGIADFATQLAISKGIGSAVGEVGSLSAESINKVTSGALQGLVSTGAFDDKVIEMKKAGYDDGTAIFSGIVSGAIEAITEKYSVDALLKAKIGTKTYKAIAKNFLIEGSEEVASDILNIVNDVAVQGESPEFTSQVNYWVKHGYSKEEATKKAIMKTADNITQSFLAGGIMGGVFGGVNQIAQNRSNKVYVGTSEALEEGSLIIETGNADALIERAKSVDVDTSSAEYALKKLRNITPDAKGYDDAVTKAQKEVSALLLYAQQGGADISDIEQNAVTQAQALQQETVQETTQEQSGIYELINEAKSLGVDTANIQDTVDLALETVENLESKEELSEQEQKDLNEGKFMLNTVQNYLSSQIQEAVQNNEVKDSVTNAIETGEVNKSTTERITESLGARAVNKRIEAEQKNEIARKTRQENGNYVSANIISELDDTQKSVNKIFANNNIKTVWFNNAEIKTKDGKTLGRKVNGFTDGKTIYLNADLPLDRQVFKHEYTHTLEKAEGFEEFRKNVVKSDVFKSYILNKYKGAKTYSQAFAKEADNIRKKQGKLKNLSNEQVENEIIADFVEDMLFSGKNSYEGLKQIEKAYGNDKKGFKRFLDWLKTFIAKFKDAFNIRHPIKSSTTASSIMKLEKNIVELQKEIDEGKVVDNKKEGVTYSESKAGLENSAFSIGEETDTEYMQAVENGDTATAQKLVDDVAMQWGAYSEDGKTPLKLYHGTKAFGFTEFDLDKMDDKQSIFLTSDIDTASGYSATTNTRSVNSSSVDVDKMSNEELADYLTKNDPNKDYAGSNTHYDYYSKDKILKTISSAKKEISKVAEECKTILKKYSEQLSDADKNNIDNIINAQKTNSFDDLSTPMWYLFKLSENKNIFLEQVADIEKAEQSVRLADMFDRRMNAKTLNINSGIILKTSLGGYRFEALDIKQARKLATQFAQGSNYSLYAKFENPLVIDGKGNYWDDISVNDVINSAFGEAIKEEYDEDYFDYSEQTLTTREISKYAKKAGYDGVVIKNIVDNGGALWGKESGVADIYIAFNPSQIKSADPVTYDDNGNVIPLSERFKEDNKDIRYSINETFDDILDMSDKEFEKYSQQFDTDERKVAEIHRYDEIVKEYKKEDKTFKERIADAPKNLKKQIAFKAKKKLDIATKKLIKSYSVNKDVTDELVQAIDLFRTGENKEMLLSNAVDLVYDNLNGTNKRSQEFTDFARLFKNQHIKINSQLKEELGDDYREFVQKYRRAFGLVTERSKYFANALNFDELASVLNEQGYNFSEQNTSAEQLREIADFYESLKNADNEADFIAEHEEELKMQIAKDIVQSVQNSFDERYKVMQKETVDTGERLKWLVDKYGKIKKGVNAQVDVTLPKMTSENKVLGLGVRSILEKSNIQGKTREKMYEKVANEDYSHYVLTDKEAKSYANSKIKSGDGERIWFDAINRSKAPNKNEVAVGIGLINNYQNELNKAVEQGDSETADMMYGKVISTINDMITVQTRLGQAVQAFSLMKKIDGVGKLFCLQKEVEKWNNKLEKAGKETVEISEEEGKFLANAKTQDEIQEASEMLMKSIGQQLPSNWLDRWNAWRYLSMLGNARTHIRNLLGNTIMLPAKSAKDFLSAGIEKFAIRDKAKRTKSFRSSSYFATKLTNKAVYEFAKEDFEEVKDFITGDIDNKYTDKSSIEGNREVFKYLKFLNTLSELNSNLLEKEDALFLKGHYIRALSGTMLARGIENFDTLSQAQVDEIRDYAINEAKKATYRDTNAFSEWLSNTAKHSIVGDLVVNSLMPFKKTPVNILRRGFEYSPIGIIKTITKGAYDLKKGKINASQFIDGLASGMSGTAIFMLGAFLSSMGITVGGLGDDDEWFRKLNGEQEYSIQIGNKSFTVDWCTPMSLPFFMGAEVYTSMQDNKDFSFKTLTDVFNNSAEPIINLSMLQGLNSTLSGIQYSDSNNKIGSILENVIYGYFTQALPTVFGQATRSADDYRRLNYIDENSIAPTVVQKFVNTLSAKSFGVIPREKYVNAWGKTEQSTKGVPDNTVARFMQNMLNPAYVSDVNYDDVNSEIYRLYKEIGDKNILVDTVKKYVTIDGKQKNLTAKEYTKYQTKVGSLSYKYVAEVINSDFYKNADDDTKAKMINDIYKYADAVGKTTLGYDLSNSEYKIKKYIDAGITMSEYLESKYDKPETTAKKPLDKNSVDKLVDNLKETDEFKQATPKEQISMVNKVVNYIVKSQNGTSSKGDEVIEEYGKQGGNESNVLIAISSTADKKKNKEKFKAIMKTDVDDESKYIAIANIYMKNRKLDDGRKYADLTASQKLKYLLKHKSDIQDGLWTDYDINF